MSIAEKLHYTQMKESGKFERDWGSHIDTIDIADTVLLQQELDTKLQFWKTKQQEVVAKLSVLRESKTYPKEIQSYIAQYQQDAYLNVFCKWREIATTMRHKVFADDMEEEIDIFDIQCKEWGFCLRELFGVGLGTGDYGHITVEHASMLLRNFRSFRDYSNQGFEAAHKLQKQIYSRATNHDGSGEASSLDQILTHHYTERLLFLRVCFRNAKECARKGKTFYFRGCGWPNTISTRKWTAAHKRWIEVMDELFTTFMGQDLLVYRYTDELSCVVAEGSCPLLEYDDASWDAIGKIKMSERQWLEAETPRARKAKKGHIPKKTRRNLFKIRNGKKNNRSLPVASYSYNMKRKLISVPSSVTAKRKQPIATSTSKTSQESYTAQTRRSLFGSSKRKRKQCSPLTTSSPKRKTPLLSTPLATPLSSDSSGRQPSLSTSSGTPASDSSGHQPSLSSSFGTPASDSSGHQPSLSTSSGTPSSDSARKNQTSNDIEFVKTVTNKAAAENKVKSLGKLTQTEFDIIASPNGWLDCVIIQEAQILLKEVNPIIEGFQRPTLGPVKQFDVMTAEFIQLLHVDENHWVCMNSIGCLPGDVKLLDSLMKPVISQEIQELAENLLGPNLNSITSIRVQQQTNLSDCGVFAIAFATCLVFGQDPSQVTFDIPRMRPHLMSCLQAGAMHLFPTT